MIESYKDFHKNNKDKDLSYLVGKHVQIIHMDDQYGVEGGTIGVVDYIDDINNIFVKWENGSSLTIIDEIDEYRIMSNEEVRKHKATKKFNL